ncbi:hypothetical protein HYPSUDRAFT_458569 [Hypholoma sublateritium FD-334 SS-4]|uniref:Uncharacterized protein n=1 Tax=Hypholoma sublateritium (strain FD-334 SS-4) TaxID=945553 RepID=A0A0D2P0U2_HYPSF|nr:hypothetical protein HYPSUDRAFT_458569 [Hypholoma sublateritium FD-334 SS-4]
MKYNKSAKTRSSEIDIRLERDGASSDDTLDILLLEPEGSYTAQSVLNQMSLMCSGGFNIEERIALRETVFRCIIEKVRSTYFKKTKLITTS